ncbi:MAG TPA: hypothetical protein VH183_02930 [Burkholderiaceae bacterium]|jgi:hypothetical protein|nr:hypothetical protein [Burkholderiaceae bacterium]
MKTRFNKEVRFSASGVITAAVLVAIVSMAIYTLLLSKAPPSGISAGSPAAQVAPGWPQRSAGAV